MKLRRLTIRNYRGIRRCDWDLTTNLLALVGPGDSTKTTLLDAVGAVLSPTYTLKFTDADFFQCATTEPITITAVVTDLPDFLVQENQLGKDRSGIHPDGTLVHDPVEGVQECLIIRLTVSIELEPVWEVIRPDSEEARPISASQRQRLGFFRVGDDADLHLRWTRTSALSGLTSKGHGPAVVLEAHRQARNAVFDAQPQALLEAAAIAQDSARKIGSAPFQRLRPGLEPSTAASAHGLVLHEDMVPLTHYGLGTRRLTSLGIQAEAVAEGSIITIDEIESGLEPHRLTHLLHLLNQETANQSIQVIFTTHSPIAVENLTTSDLAVVRHDGGITTVHGVPSALEEAPDVQGVLRSAPSAVLARKIIVGEGATEVGFLRGVFKDQDVRRRTAGQPGASSLGLAIVDGKGGTAPSRACLFQQLGYPSLLLIDNDDRSVDDAARVSEEQGVQVLRWTYERALEDELAHALDSAGLQDLVKIAADMRSEEGVCSAVAAKLGVKKLEGINPLEWAAATGMNLEDVRIAIGLAAKSKNAWFKSEEGGERLAQLTMAYQNRLRSDLLPTVMRHLIEFVYDEQPVF